jgi:hypothetical protein
MIDYPFGLEAASPKLLDDAWDELHRLNPQVIVYGCTAAQAEQPGWVAINYAANYGGCIIV